MKPGKWVVVGIVGLAFLLAGCGGQGNIPITSVETAGAAAVTRVEILVLSEPRGEVRVVASGLLPGECYRLGQETITRTGNTFEINLTMARQDGAVCPQDLQDFERLLTLPDRNLPAGSYQVQVNGVKQSFTITGEPNSQAANQPLAQAATETPAGPVPSAQPTSEPPAAQSTPSEPAPVDAQNVCEDRVAFVADVTVPDYTALQPGEAFTKTWRVRNLGSCAWKAGYTLRFMNGEAMTTTMQVDLPPAQPGATAEVSIPMQAPARAGGYTGNWEFTNPGGKVISLADSPEDWIWVKVNVAASQAQAQSAGQPATAPAVSQPPATPTLIPPLGVASCPAQPDEAFAGQVLTLINEQRARMGVAALKLNQQLTAAAVQHSKDMACNNFVEHYGTNGSTWFTRIQAQGYGYAYASENVAAGEPKFGGTASWVVLNNWMNSQVHRENILNPQVTEVGVAMVYSSSANWGAYTTVDFATPKR